jgi:outer membrane receptor for ferrienterochelin and colicins
LRSTFYDDNTPATEFIENGNAQNNPSLTWLPGIFLQDEIALSTRTKLLLGTRYDYNSRHGSIFSPRANVKITSRNKRQTLRLGAGNGYRVASVFTEDHAALTGARQVVFAEALNPETSWNFNTNFTSAMLVGRTFLSFDVAAFYTRFSNRIVADYDTDPNKIIYTNLAGYAVNRGLSANIQATLPFGLTADVGVTAMDAFLEEHGHREVPYFTEQFSAVYKLQYPFARIGLVVDVTGNLVGPMRLPRLSALDPRPQYSPWWGSQNVQLTKGLRHDVQVFGGIKNFLNYRPAANSIARPHDPFDKLVQFDAAGNALPTAENPYALTFDPGYAYAPMQGIRFFLGLRYHID